MKKILLFACLVAGSLTTFAQTNDKFATFGIVGGLNFAQLHLSDNNSSATANTGTLTTFAIGGFADLKLSDKFSLQPMLLYSGKGGQNTESGVSIKSKIFYLEVPVNLVYHLPVSFGNFYLAAGPYFSYGLSAKVTGSAEGNSSTIDVGFGNDDESYQRTDAGIDFIIGLKLNNGLLFNLSSDLGLKNISNQSADLKYTTRTSGISVGYAF